MEKTEARRLVAEAIRHITPAARRQKSGAICDRLSRLPGLLEARKVMAFLPLPDEVDLRPLLKELTKAGKLVFVPRTIVKERRMFPVRLRDVADVRPGDYGIKEPRGDEECGPRELDFIIVPGRAFDFQGNRLGRGASYYDRFLPTAENAVTCGACFDCQIIEDLPYSRKDVPVDMIVTETRQFSRSQRTAL